MSLYEHPARRLEFAMAGAVLVWLLQVGIAADLQQPLLSLIRLQAETWVQQLDWIRGLLLPTTVAWV